MPLRSLLLDARSGTERRLDDSGGATGINLVEATGNFAGSVPVKRSSVTWCAGPGQRTFLPGEPRLCQANLALDLHPPDGRGMALLCAYEFGECLSHFCNAVGLRPLDFLALAAYVYVL